MFLNELFEKTINEGLKSGDLRDVVKNTISIDQFYGKLDDDNIVVVFYVDDEDPAYDLCDFIDKSEVEHLDAEVSNVPNENGRFLVYVEFIRNKKFPGRCSTLIRSISNLVKIKKWYFETYNVDSKLKLSKETIKNNVRLNKSGRK